MKVISLTKMQTKRRATCNRNAHLYLDKRITRNIRGEIVKSATPSSIAKEIRKHE